MPFQQSTEDLASRDLGKARDAYMEGDAEASRAAHTVTIYEATESHKVGTGGYIKSAVFGGMDGIITTFAIVSGIAGADLSSELVLVLGIANLLADGISMGFGDFISSQAENEYAHYERKREAWEFENYPEGEINAMVEIYTSKGVEKGDAEQILQLMSKYPDFFVDHMMVQELGIMMPDEDDSPAKDGLVTFTSFLIFGSFPLIAYTIFEEIDIEGDFNWPFFFACVVTAIALFALGTIKGLLTNKNKWVSGLWVLLNGALAAAAAYFIGFGLRGLVDEECS
eukprot:Clim_evm18s108 gene=Clim_evmTU18s108